MKKRVVQLFTNAAAIMAMIAALSFPALAGATWCNGGRFTNFDNLTWSANDGTNTTYGRGPKFSDIHPEITDPEYYLKEKVRYPGEGGDAVSVYNSKGEPKAEYDAASVEKAREFLNSFDWIHSDELTRAKMVHDRVSNGFKGNVYGKPDMHISYSVLVTGKGKCGNFSGEFEELADFVGLECVLYTPCFNHQACMVKIAGQWFAVDPTGSDPFLSNGKTYPVDFDTEYTRWEKQSKAEREAEYAANPNSVAAQLDAMDKQLAAGIITAEQYEAKYAEMIKK